MSAITESMTVNEVLQRWPESAAVLNRYTLDMCCGGAMPLSLAAASAGVAVADLVRELNAAVASGFQVYTLTEAKPGGTPPVLKEELYRQAAHDFNLVRVEAGAGKPPHPYADGDSFMLVLSGQLELQVDGQSQTLNPGQLAFIPKGAVRGFTAGPAGAAFFAAHLRG